LKTCRNRQELVFLEQELEFTTPKHWSMLLTAHTRAGNLARALDIPSEMRTAGVAPDVFTYTCLIKACEQEWQMALWLFRQMRDERIHVI
jgi:pentatricopeptide repeat protein